MNIKLIQLLIAIFIQLSADVSAQDKNCIRYFSNSPTCIFNGVKSPSELYNLSPLNDPNFKEITTIKFNNSRMYHLPSEVTKTYINLEDLDISYTRISRFDGMDFSNTNKLMKLNASNNAIHSLPTDLSIKFRYMRNLDISHNFIEIIDTGAFSYNSNLTYLNLSNNLLEVIEKDFLYAIRSVKILHLNYNRISEIRGDLAGISFDFEEVYLNDNHLKTIDPNMIQNLAVLDISRNRLEGQFNFNNAKFRELNIRANFIESLRVSRLLEVLDASDSNERQFKINFGLGSAMKELKLSNLDVVDYGPIIRLVKNLKDLEVLDLSHNNLEIFDFRQAATSLEDLNLERTNLRSIDNLKYIKVLIPNLKQLNIQDNLFDCSEFPQIIDTLKEQNINITGLVDGGLQEFVEKNCAAPSHRGDHQVCPEGGSGVLMFFFIVSLFFNVICGVVFVYFKYVGFGKNPMHLLMRDF
ncbi:leucine-rich repeat protein SHOC-2-like [Chironomus tepperi]|uniref:leucine-rich repeat protein SHOC-2-like n=1 Tax=Chironomus tepperi TaxID=113505 RepID=UPI00391F03D0